MGKASKRASLKLSSRFVAQDSRFTPTLRLLCVRICKVLKFRSYEDIGYLYLYFERLAFVSDLGSRFEVQGSRFEFALRSLFARSYEVLKLGSSEVTRISAVSTFTSSAWRSSSNPSSCQWVNGWMGRRREGLFRLAGLPACRLASLQLSSRFVVQG